MKIKKKKMIFRFSNTLELSECKMKFVNIENNLDNSPDNVYFNLIYF
jgi:hypothetical protein